MVWPGALVIGLVAAGISLARVLIVNPTALTTLVWAEDGIFPLCVDKVGPLSCTFDAYAGYLIFLPRLLAIPISWLPLEAWSSATNVVAACLAGVLSAVSFGALVSWGRSSVTSGIVALLPVAAPIVGFEAINVYSSAYMLLLFTMTIVLATWVNDRNSWWVGLGLVVTALTIPSAVVLLLPVILLWMSRRLSGSSALILMSSLVAGLLVQFGVALGASNPRPIAVSWESVNGWVDNIPVAVATLWPGVSFGPVTIFGIFQTPVQMLTGWIVVAILVIVGVVCLTKRDRVLWAVGTLLVSGVAIGAIPTVIGYVNNRYYVVPVLLWASAGFLAISRIRWKRPLVVGVGGLAFLILVWWPAFPASTWRATATPSWVDEVARIHAQCDADISANVNVVFTPDWPMPQVELSEPTTGSAKCIEVSNG